MVIIDGAQARCEHAKVADVPGLLQLINSKALIYNNGEAEILSP